MRTVEHPDLGLAISVPDAWEVAMTPTGVLASAPDDLPDPFLPAGAAVTLEPLDGDWTAATVAEQGLLAEARLLTDLRLIDEGPGTLAGLPAHRSLATYRQGVSSLTVEQWHAVHERGILVLAGMARTSDYPAQHELWRGMLATLRVR